MTRMEVQSDPELYDCRFKDFFDMRLKFFNFLIAEETKDVVMNSINGILPFSLLIIGKGSRFPRMLNLIHPLYRNVISINCSSYKESINYDSYHTLNYNFNPSTQTLSIFISNMIGRRMYVSSAHISDIEKSFETGNNETLANILCNFEYIPRIENVKSGIRLNENTVVLSKNHEMPVIIERG